MGAGASIEVVDDASAVQQAVQQALDKASAVEINAVIAELPPDLKEKLKAALIESPTSEFRKGQDVECRNGLDEWRPGKVLAIDPKLMVKRKEDWMPKAWDEVRALEAERSPTEVAEALKLDTKTATIARPATAKFVATNDGKISDFYEVDKKKLGEGGYATCSKAENKATLQVCAVKSIGKGQVKNFERLKLEIEVQASMDHPNIAKLYETFEDHRNLYLVMELMVGGELFDRIIENGHFTEKQAAVVMKQAFRAEFYMNEQGICHRDLKPENFLFLDKSPIETSPLKLIDFGLACKCAEGQVLTTKAGTPYYVAPQVLAGKYDMGSDMWSLGVIFYVLICGYPPFFGESDAEVLSKVRLGNYSFNASDWKNVSEACKNLIRQCLKMNPKDRFTPEQALKHEWISSMESSESVAVDATFLDNFKQFRSATKFHKVARQAIAMRAKEGDIKKLRETFLALDADGNGTLTLDELKDAIQKAGLEDMPSDFNDIMNSIGSVGLNRVDYTEFLAATLDQKVFTDTDQLWSAFRMFDKNGDGGIDLEELKKMLSDGGADLSEEASAAAQKLITEADTNGDSKIDFNEFAEMMRAGA